MSDRFKPRTSYEKCSAFQLELNAFITSRCEEWDLNEYEIIGVMVSELFEQLAYIAVSFDEITEDDNSEDEDEDD